MSMPHEPTAPPGVRLFGRIDRFHCECPTCGELIVGDVDPRRSRKRALLATRASTQQWQKRTSRAQARMKQGRKYPYNAFLQTLTCPFCERVYVVGLLLWTLERGSRIKQAPSDTVPTRRQLAQFRAHVEGRWPWLLKRFGESVNVYVTEPCSCTPEHREPACPVHGDNATSGPPIEGE